MIEDSELLRRYVEERSEEAFAELVRRHVNLVYAGAIRRLGGDTHRAQDVTQEVFTALATGASRLARRPVLAGWLHITTRNIAAQVVRSERRRAARELAVHVMNDPTIAEPAQSADWERLRPVIDGALDELDERDREAVILRYFEGRSLADIGARLRLTENAARMRVHRALEQMYGRLTRRGVNSTVGALSLVLTSQADVTAPVGFAAKVIGVSTAAVAAGATGLTLLNLMSTSKIITTVAGIAAVAALGVAVNQANESSQARSELASARRELNVAAGRLHKAERALQAETAKADTANRTADVLLMAIDRAETEAKTPPAPVTDELVQSRYKHGQDLGRKGDFAGALAEFLWCYDHGMVQIASFRGVRNSFLLGEIARLATSYPPAMTALRERQEQSEQQMLVGINGQTAAADFAALNATLGEDDRNLTAFNQLPPGDPRRQGLLGRVYPQLLASQRYADAAEALPFSQMVRQFDTVSAALPNVPTARNYLIETTAKNIEVLAGSGQLDSARTLTGKLLALDSSNVTRGIVQEHAIRAGHPELLASPPVQ